MATYKVLQDIEAEDKLLGPLTLKQFIFAIITIVLGFLCYVFYQINFLLAIPWLLPISFFGFMAAPISRDQPNDIWLASRLRFMIKPKKRVWDQFGMQELVTINAPKKIEIQRTDGLNQTEVRSRLSALSSMMDTRGWAVKNETLALDGNNPYGASTQGERLFELTNQQSATDSQWVSASDDILDEKNNLVAQRIDTTIKQKQTDKINALKTKMQSGAIDYPQEQFSETTNEDYSFIFKEKSAAEPGYANFGSRVIQPGTDLSEINQITPNDIGKEEELLLEKIHRDKELKEQISSSSHEHKLNPTQKTTNDDKKTESTTTQSNSNAIIKQLSQSSDISVASIASLAKHAKDDTFSDNDIISLH